MSNIVKSLCMIRRRYIVSICGLFILSLAFVFFELILGLINPSPLSCLSTSSLASASDEVTMIMGIIPVIVIGSGYTWRIQMYEIMSGYRPNQIMFARVLVILPITMSFLAITAIVYLIADHSTEMIATLILFCTICIRMTLCVIFLSPLTKQLTFLPTFSALILLAMDFYPSMESFNNSVFSFTCFGQCALFAGGVTEGVTESLMIKIIVSSVVACVIYYLIGYFTLKKKISLESHPIN